MNTDDDKKPGEGAPTPESTGQAPEPAPAPKAEDTKAPEPAPKVEESKPAADVKAEPPKAEGTSPGAVPKTGEDPKLSVVGAGVERVKFKVTGAVTGTADVMVGSTIAEALKLAGVTAAASSLNLRDKDGNAVKPSTIVSETVTYTAKGDEKGSKGSAEASVSSSRRMAGG